MARPAQMIFSIPAASFLSPLCEYKQEEEYDYHKQGRYINRSNDETKSSKSPSTILESAFSLAVVGSHLYDVVVLKVLIGKRLAGHDY
jgi:hypothetical protein